MLFLIIAVVVGWMADRIWPTLVIWAVGYAVIATPLQMLMAQHNREALGETMDWSAPSVATAMAIGAGLFLVIAIASFGVKTLVKKKSDN